MTSGLTTTATSALSRETPTKETREMPEIHLHTETPKTVVSEEERDSETVEISRCWSVVASVGQWCLAVGAGSNKAANAVCLATFDPITFCSLSQMAEF